jgi:hypothetical protein
LIASKPTLFIRFGPVGGRYRVGPPRALHQRKDPGLEESGEGTITSDWRTQHNLKLFEPPDEHAHTKSRRYSGVFEFYVVYHFSI